MALKSKHTTTSYSSVVTAPTTVGGSPPQEAPISDNKWLRHCRTQRDTVTSFLSSKFSLKLNSRREAHRIALCKCDSSVDEQNMNFDDPHVFVL